MILFNREQRQELWYTLKRNKRRTIITSIGVFAGMFFFTVLIGIGQGLQNSSDKILNSVSNNLYIAMLGKTTMPYEGYQANRRPAINYKDYIEIKQKVKSIETFALSTQWSENWSDLPVVANLKSRKTGVVGVDQIYITHVGTLTPIYGRLFTEAEIRDNSAVCVVGERIAERFYGEGKAGDMVDTYITIDAIPFRVVGVVLPYQNNFNLGYNPKFAITVPFKSALKNNLEKEIYLYAIPRNGVTSDQYKSEIFPILAKNHHIHPEDTESLQIISMDMFTNIFKMIGKGIQLLIWVVGMGTLLTGVIGVSNILLVTVRERQREIGVRRAIGAKPRDIRVQFMAEAMVIIFMAGFVGVFFGLLVDLGIGAMAENIPKIAQAIERPYPTIEILLISILIMIIAGILAGLLPVYKALQIKAIDAIRDE